MTNHARRDRSASLILAAAVAVLLIAVLQAAYRFGQPTDGWILAGSTGWLDGRYLLERYQGDEPTPLREGDRILAIDGRPIREIVAGAIAGGRWAPAGWRDGGSVGYTVERGGLAREVEVRPWVRSAGQVLRDLARRQLEIPGSILIFAVALFVFARRPEVVAARLLFGFGVLTFAGTSISEAVAGTGGSLSDLLTPWAFWGLQIVHNLAWPVAILPMLAHLFLAFPIPKRVLTAHPRVILGLLYGVMPVGALAAALTALGDPVAGYAVLIQFGIAASLVPMAVIVGAAGHSLLTLRDPGARAQIRWVAWSALLIGVAALGGFAAMSLGTVPARLVLDATGILWTVFPVSLGAAILRYRLFDIEVVLNRTIVYLTLTACIVGVYILTVTLAGLLVQERASFAVSLLATGLVAVLVQPLRARLQRAVDRLIYGERDDPYAVVSRLGQRLQATVAPDAVLSAVVETVAAALKLPFAAVELTDQGRVIAAARVGQPRGDLERLPLTYQGESLGALVLAPRSPDEMFGLADRRLLEVLARQAGVAAHAVRLTGDLARSRQRLVAAREEERRRLRRDLHDGLGPLLAAMTLKLDAAANLVERDAAAAETLLTGLVGDVRRIRADIRRLVDDLRPPALDEVGLGGAIRDGVQGVAGSGESAGLIVSVDLPDRLPDLPAAVEVAAYRIALEAVTNVARHAAARKCRVRLGLVGDDGPALTLAVEDDGRGLPPDYRAGVGLVSMRERATELGGQCIIERGPTGGTHVRAWLPLPTT